MNYEIITAPLIGAAIGFITNGIAIKMLFRPWKPIYIGKFRLPFTPGLIPKEQPRIAAAIGKVVGNNLLDNETIKETLLSDETKNKLFTYIDKKIMSLSENTQTLSEFLDSKNILAGIDEKEKSTRFTISDAITSKLIDANVSSAMVDFASEELVKNANPMIAGIASKAINSARDSIIKKIEGLIKSKAPDIIADFIDKEYEKLKSKPINECTEIMISKFPDYKERIWKLFNSLIQTQLSHILHGFNIQGIVEQKIIQYELPELENLIMAICKKELNALVILGGVLGLLMGFLNVVI